MTTVREAKKARTSIQDLLEYCAKYLAKDPDQAGLGARAAAAVQRMDGLTFDGKEADEASAGTVGTIREAVALGVEILGATDAGHTLPHVSSWIEESQKLTA